MSLFDKKKLAKERFNLVARSTSERVQERAEDAGLRIRLGKSSLAAIEYGDEVRLASVVEQARASQNEFVGKFTQALQVHARALRPHSELIRQTKAASDIALSRLQTPGQQLADVLLPVERTYVELFDAANIDEPDVSAYFFRDLIDDERRDFRVTTNDGRTWKPGEDSKSAPTPDARTNVPATQRGDQLNDKRTPVKELPKKKGGGFGRFFRGAAQAFGINPGANDMLRVVDGLTITRSGVKIAGGVGPLAGELTIGNDGIEATGSVTTGPVTIEGGVSVDKEGQVTTNAGVSVESGSGLVAGVNVERGPDGEITTTLSGGITKGPLTVEGTLAIDRDGITPGVRTTVETDKATVEVTATTADGVTVTAEGGGLTATYGGADVEDAVSSNGEIARTFFDNMFPGVLPQGFSGIELGNQIGDVIPDKAEDDAITSYDKVPDQLLQRIAPTGVTPAVDAEAARSSGRRDDDTTKKPTTEQVAKQTKRSQVAPTPTVGGNALTGDGTFLRGPTGSQRFAPLELKTTLPRPDLDSIWGVATQSLDVENEQPTQRSVPGNGEVEALDVQLAGLRRSLFSFGRQRWNPTRVKRSDADLDLPYGNLSRTYAQMFQRAANDASNVALQIGDSSDQSVSSRLTADWMRKQILDGAAYSPSRAMRRWQQTQMREAIRQQRLLDQQLQRQQQRLQNKGPTPTPDGTEQANLVVQPTLTPFRTPTLVAQGDATNQTRTPTTWTPVPSAFVLRPTGNASQDELRNPFTANNGTWTGGLLAGEQQEQERAAFTSRSQPTSVTRTRATFDALRNDTGTALFGRGNGVFSLTRPDVDVLGRTTLPLGATRSTNPFSETTERDDRNVTFGGTPWRPSLGTFTARTPGFVTNDFYRDLYADEREVDAIEQWVFGRGSSNKDRPQQDTTTVQSNERPVNGQLLTEEDKTKDPQQLERERLEQQKIQMEAQQKLQELQRAQQRNQKRGGAERNRQGRRNNTGKNRGNKGKNQVQTRAQEQQKRGLMYAERAKAQVIEGLQKHADFALKLLDMTKEQRIQALTTELARQIPLIRTKIDNAKTEATNRWTADRKKLDAAHTAALAKIKLDCDNEETICTANFKQIRQQLKTNPPAAANTAKGLAYADAARYARTRDGNIKNINTTADNKLKGLNAQLSDAEGRLTSARAKAAERDKDGLATEAAEAAKAQVKMLEGRVSGLRIQIKDTEDQRQKDVQEQKNKYGGIDGIQGLIERRKKEGEDAAEQILNDAKGYLATLESREKAMKDEIKKIRNEGNALCNERYANDWQRIDKELADELLLLEMQFVHEQIEAQQAIKLAQDDVEKMTDADKAQAKIDIAKKRDESIAKIKKMSVKQLGEIYKLADAAHGLIDDKMKMLGEDVALAVEKVSQLETTFDGKIDRVKQYLENKAYSAIDAQENTAKLVSEALRALRRRTHTGAYSEGIMDGLTQARKEFEQQKKEEEAIEKSRKEQMDRLKTWEDPEGDRNKTNRVWDTLQGEERANALRERAHRLNTALTKGMTYDWAEIRLLFADMPPEVIEEMFKSVDGLKAKLEKAMEGTVTPDSLALGRVLDSIKNKDAVALRGAILEWSTTGGTGGITDPLVIYNPVNYWYAGSYDKAAMKALFDNMSEVEKKELDAWYQLHYKTSVKDLVVSEAYSVANRDDLLASWTTDKEEALRLRAQNAQLTDGGLMGVYGTILGTIKNVGYTFGYELSNKEALDIFMAPTDMIAWGFDKAAGATNDVFNYFGYGDQIQRGQFADAQKQVKDSALEMFVDPAALSDAQRALQKDLQPNPWDSDIEKRRKKAQFKQIMDDVRIDGKTIYQLNDIAANNAWQKLWGGTDGLNKMFDAIEKNDEKEFLRRRMQVGLKQKLGKESWITEGLKQAAKDGEMDEVLNWFKKEGIDFEKAVDERFPGPYLSVDRAYFKMLAEKQIDPTGFSESTSEAEKEAYVRQTAIKLAYYQHGGITGWANDLAGISAEMARLPKDLRERVAAEYAKQVESLANNGEYLPPWLKIALDLTGTRKTVTEYTNKYLPNWAKYAMDPFSKYSTGNLWEDLKYTYGGQWNDWTGGLIGKGLEYEYLLDDIEHGGAFTAEEKYQRQLRRYKIAMSDTSYMDELSIKMAKSELDKLKAAYESLPPDLRDKKEIKLEELTADQREAYGQFTLRLAAAQGWQDNGNLNAVSYVERIGYIVGTAVTTAIIIVGSFFTGGAVAYIVVPIAAAIIGGLAMVGTKVVMLGNKYSGASFQKDLAEIAIDAIMAGCIGALEFNSLASNLIKRLGVTNKVAQAILGEILQNLMSFPLGYAKALLDPAMWQGDSIDILRRLISKGLLQAGSNIVTSAATAGTLKVIKLHGINSPNELKNALLNAGEEALSNAVGAGAGALLEFDPSQPFGPQFLNVLKAASLTGIQEGGKFMGRGRRQVLAGRQLESNQVFLRGNEVVVSENAWNQYRTDITRYQREMNESIYIPDTATSVDPVSGDRTYVIPMSNGNTTTVVVMSNVRVALNFTSGDMVAASALATSPSKTGASNAEADLVEEDKGEVQRKRQQQEDEKRREALAKQQGEDFKRRQEDSQEDRDAENKRMEDDFKRRQDEENAKRQQQADDFKQKRDAAETKKRQEAEALKKQQELEALRQRQEADEVKKQQELDALRQRQEADEVKKQQELEKLQKQQQADALKNKQELEKLQDQQEAERLEKARQVLEQAVPTNASDVADASRQARRDGGRFDSTLIDGRTVVTLTAADGAKRYLVVDDTVPAKRTGNDERKLLTTNQVTDPNRLLTGLGEDPLDLSEPSVQTKPVAPQYRVAVPGDRPVEVRMDPRQFQALQDDVQKSNIDRKEKNLDAALAVDRAIRIIEHEGKFYIWDGHHTVVAAIQSRRTDVPVTVYTVAQAERLGFKVAELGKYPSLKIVDRFGATDGTQVPLVDPEQPLVASTDGRGALPTAARARFEYLVGKLGDTDAAIRVLVTEAGFRELAARLGITILTVGGNLVIERIPLGGGPPQRMTDLQLYRAVIRVGRLLPDGFNGSDGIIEVGNALQRRVTTSEVPPTTTTIPDQASVPVRTADVVSGVPNYDVPAGARQSVQAQGAQNLGLYRTTIDGTPAFIKVVGAKGRAELAMVKLLSDLGLGPRLIGTTEIDGNLAFITRDLGAGVQLDGDSLRRLDAPQFQALSREDKLAIIRQIEAMGAVLDRAGLVPSDIQLRYDAAAKRVYVIDPSAFKTLEGSGSTIGATEFGTIARTLRDGWNFPRVAGGVTPDATSTLKIDGAEATVTDLNEHQVAATMTTPPKVGDEVNLVLDLGDVEVVARCRVVEVKGDRVTFELGPMFDDVAARFRDYVAQQRTNDTIDFTTLPDAPTAVTQTDDLKMRSSLSSRDGGAVMTAVKPTDLTPADVKQLALRNDSDVAEIMREVRDNLAANNRDAPVLDDGSQARLVAAAVNRLSTIEAYRGKTLSELLADPGAREVIRAAVYEASNKTTRAFQPSADDIQAMTDKSKILGEWIADRIRKHCEANDIALAEGGWLSRLTTSGEKQALAAKWRKQLELANVLATRGLDAAQDTGEKFILIDITGDGTYKEKGQELSAADLVRIDPYNDSSVSYTLQEWVKKKYARQVTEADVAPDAILRVLDYVVRGRGVETFTYEQSLAQLQSGQAQNVSGYSARRQDGQIKQFTVPRRPEVMVGSSPIDGVIQPKRREDMSADELVALKIAERGEAWANNEKEGSCALIALHNQLSAIMKGLESNVVVIRGVDPKTRRVELHAVTAIKGSDGKWRFLSWGRPFDSIDQIGRLAYGDDYAVARTFTTGETGAKAKLPFAEWLLNNKDRIEPLSSTGRDYDRISAEARNEPEIDVDQAKLDAAKLQNETWRPNLDPRTIDQTATLTKEEIARLKNAEPGPTPSIEKQSDDVVIRTEQPVRNGDGVLVGSDGKPLTLKQIAALSPSTLTSVVDKTGPERQLSNDYRQQEIVLGTNTAGKPKTASGEVVRALLDDIHDARMKLLASQGADEIPALDHLNRLLDDLDNVLRTPMLREALLEPANVFALAREAVVSNRDKLDRFISENIKAFRASQDQARQGVDPVRRAQREVFEREVALLVLRDGPVKAAVDGNLDAMCAKILAYIDATAMSEDHKVQLLIALGAHVDTGYAGAVLTGDAVNNPQDRQRQAQTMIEVLTKGNVRERMIAIESFGRVVAGQLANSQFDRVVSAQRDGASGAFDQQAIRAFQTRWEKFVAERGGTVKKGGEKELLKPLAEEVTGDQAAYADAKRQSMDAKIPSVFKDDAELFLGQKVKADEDGLVPGAENSPLARTPLTVREAIAMGFQLSEREIAAAGGLGAKLPWVVGTVANVVDPNADFIANGTSLSLPQKAGISGTTFRFMMVATMLGGDPALSRLAAIGALQTIDAHTVYEIASAAQGFGMPFDPTRPYDNLGIPVEVLEQIARAMGTTLEELNATRGSGGTNTDADTERPIKIVKASDLEQPRP